MLLLIALLILKNQSLSLSASRGSDLIKCWKKPNMVGHSYNPDNQEAEAGDLKVQYYLRLFS